jgi:RNA polymerase sigma factor (sigma-70 family)
VSRGPVRAEDELSALDAVYREHYTALVRIAFLLTGSAAAAEDAVHEVIVRCAPRIETLDHAPSYLRAAVVNECRAQNRRGRRRPVPFDDGRQAAASELPHDLVETRDALAALTPRRRAAVVLRYYVEEPNEEIARLLGCRPATVRSLIHRGLNQLREALK